MMKKKAEDRQVKISDVQPDTQVLVFSEKNLEIYNKERQAVQEFVKNLG